MWCDGCVLSGDWCRSINDTLWQAFMSYDLDENQTLCVGELFEMLRSLNFPQECVEEEFQNADMDKDGKVAVTVHELTLA